MRKLLLLTCLVTLMVGLAGPALAYPTLVGPTGIVQLPTADKLPAGAFDLAFDWTKIGIDGDVTLFPVRLVAGITDRAELGVIWARAENSGSGNVIGANGKILLLREPISGVSVAAGALVDVLSDDDVFGEIRDVTVIQAYAVASKDLSAPLGLAGKARLSGHLGLMFTKVKDGSIDESSIRPYIGAEITAPEGGSVAVEFRAKDSDIDRSAVWSVVARYPFAQAFTVQAGVVNLFGASGHKLTLGVNYRFHTPSIGR